MSKELKVEDLSPKAREELNNLCNKLKKGDNTGQLLSRKDQMFYLEGKIINQIYSVIEQCPIDKLKDFWKGLTKRGKIVVGALVVILGMIIYGYIF